MKKTILISLVTLSALPSLSFAAEDAGRVMFVAGKAMIVDAKGQERAARKGAILKQGDRLVTSEQGMIQVKMRDEGVMAIRPNTDLKLNNLLPLASKSDSPSQALLLTKGGVRVLTGSANNKLGYLIKTAASSFKLREGDTEALVMPPLTPAAGSGKTDGLPVATYNRVNSGSGTFQAASGNVLTLAPNQVSYTTSVNPTPVLVASLPVSYINTTVPLQINNTSTSTLAPTTLIAPSTLNILAPINTTSTTLVASTTLAPATNLTTAPTTLATAPLTTTLIATAPLTTTLIATAPVAMVAPLPPPPVVAPVPYMVITPQPIVQPVLQPISKICTVGKTC